MSEFEPRYKKTLTNQLEALVGTMAEVGQRLAQGEELVRVQWEDQRQRRLLLVDKNMLRVLAGGAKGLGNELATNVVRNPEGYITTVDVQGRSTAINIFQRMIRQNS